MTKYRKASHAGSWYKSSGKELNKELTGWLNEASESYYPARAIIGPHAGYSYSGPCAAFAYKQIDPSTVKQIFLLGPSHHIHLDGCALTSVQYYSTPLYDIPIDANVCKELSNTGQFETMSVDTDEDEHSLEMHLPYIAKVMEDYQKQYKIIPILVGSLTFKKEQTYGQILAPYLKDPNTLFIISSDFCHWGSRFRYTYYEENAGEIWESIKKIDQMGMSLIESLDHKKFNEYLKEYRNTICGRHPIGILLATIEVLQSQKKGYKFGMKFVQYAQSNKCKSMNDSSVSYASGVLRID